MSDALLQARRAVAASVEDFCRKMAERVRGAGGLSEPERAHLVRAFTDMADQMSKRAKPDRRVHVR